MYVSGHGAIIARLMATLLLTQPQQRAVETVGRSVIVSAAAGSGKTAVLAERVAYLVCDAPSQRRCDVDNLLVLTFTDAAASEMRERIVNVIRRKAKERPQDERLGQQLALVDAAQICTIHSFCLWIIRRWFNEVGIDPTASVLDEDEAALLKHDVLDELCADLYASAACPGDPLGKADAPPEKEDARFEDSHSVKGLGEAFTKLVDDYGLGSDRDVTALILNLFDFTNSLPDPDAWLNDAVECVGVHPEECVTRLAQELAPELRVQADHCDKLAAMLEASDPVAHFHAGQIRAYGDQLNTWIENLQDASGGIEDAAVDDAIDHIIDRYEAVRREIAGHEFSRKTGPRLARDAEPLVRQAYDRAREQLSQVKKNLFAKRLKGRFALFSTEDLLAGLARTAPYISTVVDLVIAFREAYTGRKRRMGVLDFADFERLALGVLHSKDDCELPSDTARTLHRKFTYVLVDEFQDINPIQEAIIRLVSRESDPDQEDNLFVVGDVKQSIYRFRLAEPAVFAERLRNSLLSTGDNSAVSLQHNFRSRREILEAVNVVFQQLMRPGIGSVVYGAEAMLEPGREDDHNGTHQPVEFHLLERAFPSGVADDDAVERGVADLENPVRWAPIEREAFLIGTRIRQWLDEDKVTLQGEPLRCHDMAILLRASKINAERMAAMLKSMGVPAYANVGGSLLGAREVRDVLAAVEVLDNAQQDIPLAAVLRSGIMGERLSEDELIEIRCLDRDVPFHTVVRNYSENGGNDTIRERLTTILGRLNRLRIEARSRPLADVLWKLCEQHGFMAYVCGLPNGSQRRANLLKLHELARKFASFRTQGLHRFLRFVQSLEEESREIAAAPAIGESEDVVRIMSIHQSKGLEFPVVFVAGLGAQFNLGDRSGRMIFERTSRIGLRVVDTERMLEYSSVAHNLVAAEVERCTREEELRILYVAMTRARDKLVLVGSKRNVRSCFTSCTDNTGTRPASLLSITSAAAPLDWLIPAVSAAQPGAVSGVGGGAPDHPLFDVRLHSVEEMAGWSLSHRADVGENAARRAVAKCDPLPPEEPLAPDDPEVGRVIERLDYVYPTLSSASVRAVMAASEFKGTYDYTMDPDQRPGGSRLVGMSETPQLGKADIRPDAAVNRGIVTHRVLQHLDFGQAVDSPGVASELQRLAGAGILTAEEVEIVDRASIEWFVSTPLAGAIRKAGDGYRREFQYIATESTTYLDRSIGASSGDDILVRGVVDGILPVEEGIEIIDFKTDAVGADQVGERAERYRPQMELYARAMSRIWRREVRACRLVFLSARKLVALKDVNTSL
ncbi:MAG: UvrD-helicase domain-containing protein [Phycisphaerales bacterium]|nr:MAG: UvrD-helicase domain-containing protein [Phycisphaerales bacterium]